MPDRLSRGSIAWVAILLLSIVPVAAAQAQKSPWQSAMDSGNLSEQHSEFVGASKSFAAARKLAAGPPPNPEQLLKSLYRLAWSYIPQGRLAEAADFFGPAVTLAEQNPELVAPDLPDCLRALARVRLLQGKYAQAEPIFKRALELIQKRNQPFDYRFGGIYEGLVKAYLHLGRRADIEALYRALEEMDRKKAAVPLLQRAPVMRTLEFLYWLRGNREQADSYSDRALQSEGAPAYEGFLDLLFVAQILNHDREPAEAESLLKRVLAQQELLWGRDDARLVSSLESLAEVLSRTNHLPEAEAALRRELAILERAGSQQEWRLPYCLRDLGRVLAREENLDKFPEAEQCMKRALDIQRKRTPQDRRLIAGFEMELGWVYAKQKRFDEAHELFAKAADACMAAARENFSSAGSCMSEYARFYRVWGKPDYSQEVFQQALTLMEFSVGPVSPSLLPVLNDYASLLRETKRTAEAAKLEARSRRIRAQNPSYSINRN